MISLWYNWVNIENGVCEYNKYKRELLCRQNRFRYLLVSAKRINVCQQVVRLHDTGCQKELDWEAYDSPADIQRRYATLTAPPRKVTLQAQTRNVAAYIELWLLIGLFYCKCWTLFWIKKWTQRVLSFTFSSKMHKDKPTELNTICNEVTRDVNTSAAI